MKKSRGRCNSKVLSALHQAPGQVRWYLLVCKKDGTLCFCIDFRQLNAVTKADVFPLPRIDNLLHQLGKSKNFTTLDLAASYWQVQMHALSKKKTPFITHKALYQFNVMPFKLCNAPAVFQV